MTRSLPRIRPLWQVALLVCVGGVGSAALRPAGAKAGPYEAPAAEAVAGEVEVEVDIVDFVAPPAVAVPVVDPPQADADDGLNDQARAFLQQQRPMYESKLTGHLYALRHLCNPTREQQELLLERTFAALGKALRAHAQRMAGGNQNVQFFMGNAFAGQQQKQPWDVVKAELEEAIGECLSAEQLALYQDDVRQREAFRRQASATNLVSAIDKQLNLTEEQREAIQASLLADWQESWEASIRGLMHSPVYLPQLPNRLINPHLSAKQKKIWSKTQRQGPVIFGDDGFMGHGVLNLLPFRAQDQRPAVDPAELDASGQEPPAQRSKT